MESSTDTTETADSSEKMSTTEELSYPEEPLTKPLKYRSNAFIGTIPNNTSFPRFPRLFNNFIEQEETAPLFEATHLTDNRFAFAPERTLTIDNDTSNDDLLTPMEIDTTTPNLFEDHNLGDWD